MELREQCGLPSTITLQAIQSRAVKPRSLFFTQDCSSRPRSPACVLST